MEGRSSRGGERRGSHLPFLLVLSPACPRLAAATVPWMSRPVCGKCEGAGGSLCGDQERDEMRRNGTAVVDLPPPSLASSCVSVPLAIRSPIPSPLTCVTRQVLPSTSCLGSLMPGRVGPRELEGGGPSESQERPSRLLSLLSFAPPVSAIVTRSLGPLLPSQSHSRQERGCARVSRVGSRAPKHPDSQASRVYLVR